MGNFDFDKKYFNYGRLRIVFHCTYNDWSSYSNSTNPLLSKTALITRYIRTVDTYITAEQLTWFLFFIFPIIKKSIGNFDHFKIITTFTFLPENVQNFKIESFLLLRKMLTDNKKHIRMIVKTFTVPPHTSKKYFVIKKM